jgi:hypothetical protein
MRARLSDTNQDQIERSDAQRRYQNLIHYRIRPMLNERGKTDEDRVALLKRLCREANLIRANSGAVAGLGTREELVDLLTPLLQKESGVPEEVQEWIVRVMRSFGASYEGVDFE